MKLMVLLALPCLLLAADPPRDIACEAADHYVGGIDRIYSLKITGPKEKKWEYSFMLAPVVNGETLKASGTYELMDDLAIFTGKDKQEAMRFGVNYGFLDGKVQFNGFFPKDEQTLQYRRQWFHKVGADWKPLAELKLTMPRTVPTGEKWTVPLKGEFIEWQANGPAKRTAIDEIVPYQQESPGIYHQTKAAGRRIPGYFFSQSKDGKLTAVLFSSDSPTPSGFLRGFHPSLATGD